MYWIVGGRSNLGDDSYMVGNILAQSSISFASRAVMDGRSLSLTTVSYAGDSSVAVPVGPTLTVKPTRQLNLGSASKFVILAGTTVSFAPSPSLTVLASGSVGSSPGDDIKGNYILAAGEIPQPGTTAASLGMDAYN